VRWQGSLALAATIAGRPGHWALATPVHLLAGLERVHLDPTGLPALSEAEQGRLADDFNRDFGTEGYSLSFVDGAGLLRMPEAIDADCHDPQRLSGADAGAWLPSGPDGPALRRLMTEIQMWLHGHAINAERERTGAAPVNALWIWGFGDGMPATGTDGLPRLASPDPFLRAVWRRSMGELDEPPAGLAVCLQQSDATRLVVTADVAGPGGSYSSAIEEADANWFAPLEAALASGRVGTARLLLAGREVTLRPRDRVRFWRRRRAWSEVLA